MPGDNAVVSDVLTQHEGMRRIRQHFEPTWTEIAERLIPRKSKFRRTRSTDDKGQQKTEKIFDASPGIALERGVAAMHSLVVPRNQQWHGLKPMDPALAEDPEVSRYLEEVTRRLFAARYSSNFDNQIHEAFFDCFSFGTMAMFVGDRLGQSLYYRAVPTYQTFIAENEFGVVDVFHREFPMTARQALARFGERCPSVIRNAVSMNMATQEFWFLHCVKPNAERDENRADYRGMQYVSYYVCLDTNDLVDVGGFRSWPYPVARYNMTPGEVYGRSPAMTVLPDIKMLNEIERTGVQARQLAVLPPLLAHRDGILDTVRLTPAAVNYGAVDDNGRARVIPLSTGAQVDLAEEKAAQKRALINDAFWNTLFQILVDQPQMTATEAMLRAQEKGALLAPTASRIETEFLHVQIERELDILAAAGQLPDMPDKLAEAGGLFEIEFSSPLTRARQSEEGVGILRAVEQLAPLAQALGPGVFRRVNADKAAKLVFTVNGVPAKVLYSDEEVEAIAEDQQQQADLQQLVQAAPLAADAAKSLAQAGALAGAAPGDPSILAQP